MTQRQECALEQEHPPEQRTAEPDLPPGADSLAVGPDAEPMDPDTSFGPIEPGPGRTERQLQQRILAAIVVGGVIGASARYEATLLWPASSGGFPWTTFGINVTGCALMGVLMVLITERFRAHPLTRPFLGTGVLGGYTTFSSATLDTRRLLDGGHGGTALLYVFGTLAGSVLAVWAASHLTRAVVPPRAEKEEPRW